MPDHDSNDHEIRTLRRRNKQLGKQLGHSGQKIHELRCELAEMREITDKIARGEVRNLERQVENDIKTISMLQAEVKWLREELHVERVV